MKARPDLAAAFEALLARSGGDVLLLVNERLEILRAGGDAATLADRPHDELAGMSLIAAYGSATLDGVARRALTSKEPVSAEAQLGRLGNRMFAVEGVPVAGGLVLLLHDVTTLRRIERVRRDFVANISHELRTPLSSIKLLAETLSSGSVDDAPTMTDFARQIEREADHLAQLVDELLDLSMIESGETELHRAPLAPDPLVADLARRIMPVAERRDVRVRQIHGESVPSLIADRERIGQAILNLAHNAVKYSRPGGEIRLGWSVRPGAVRFFVADDGVGVPQSHQPRLFERFYKVDRSRARGDDEIGGSAGLGLAIVRHIAEAHGGSVGLESEEGVGSTFWIDLPIT
jgi:two-component system, OmpR family, phosphate regulon sensor histidine kinase PhoR